MVRRLQLGFPEDALLVVAVSMQDPRKRFADVEMAVTAMNAYAVFVGQRRPRREGNVIYLGYVPDDVVRQHINLAFVEPPALLAYEW